MANESMCAAVMPCDLGQHRGKVGPTGELAFRNAVRWLVVGDYAETGREQREYEGAHLRGVATPTVREDDRRRRVLAPAPGGDLPPVVLDEGCARIDEIECGGGAAGARRREEQALGPGAGELREEQRRCSKPNVRANSGQPETGAHERAPFVICGKRAGVRALRARAHAPSNSRAAGGGDGRPARCRRARRPAARSRYRG